MDCVLTAMFIIRMLNAYMETPQIKKNVEGAHPMQARAIAKDKNPTVMGLRLSKRDTSHPEIGKPIRELIGIKSKTVPSSASL